MIFLQFVFILIRIIIMVCILRYENICQLISKLAQYYHNYEYILPGVNRNLSCIKLETNILVDKIVAYLFHNLLIQYINEEIS